MRHRHAATVVPSRNGVGRAGHWLNDSKCPANTANERRLTCTDIAPHNDPVADVQLCSELCAKGFSLAGITRSDAERKEHSASVATAPRRGPLPLLKMRALISRTQLALLLVSPAAATLQSGKTRSQEMFALLLAVWALVLLGTFLKREPLPRSRAGKVAVISLLGLAALTAASMMWASVKSPALAATILAILYAGYLLASTPALRSRASARMAEPVVWLTATASAGYGLSERVFPRQISLERSASSLGRLSEPFGYWNALGLFTGMGLILAVAIASDAERTPTLRRFAAASMPLLGAALWMTFSRGALAATAAGLFALVAMRRTRGAAAAACLAAVSFAAMAAAVEHHGFVKQVGGSLRNRLSDAGPFGVELAVAVVIAGISWTAVHAIGRSGKTLPTNATKLLAVTTALFAIAPFVSAATGQTQSVVQESGANAARLTSPESDRSAYWQVQLDDFAQSPLYGAGGGSFLPAWTQHRASREPARNAHSLPIEILGDLGLIGFLLFLALAGGIAVAARRTVAKDSRLAAGPAAALLAFAAHCVIDWDWQVPGLMLAVALLAAVPLANTSRPSGISASRSHVLQRLAIAALSAGLIAWFALLSNGLALETRAIATLNATQLLGWNPERYSRVQEELADAQKFDPDPSASIWAFLAAKQAHKDADSDRLAREVLSNNPGSWFAWQMLSFATRTTHPAESARAAKRAAELRPVRPPANR